MSKASDKIFSEFKRLENLEDFDEVTEALLGSPGAAALITLAPQAEVFAGRLATAASRCTLQQLAHIESPAAFALERAARNR